MFSAMLRKALATALRTLSPMMGASAVARQAGIASDGDLQCLLDDGMERSLQPTIPLDGQSYSFGQDLAEFFRAEIGIVESLLQLLKLNDLLSQQQRAQFGQFILTMIELRIAL